MKTAVIVMVMIAIAGCDRPKEDASNACAEQPSKVDNAVASDKRESSEIAVVIDGHQLTRDEICRRAKVELTLAMNKTRKTKVGKAEFKFFERYCRTAVKREIYRAAAAKYVRDHKLKISKDDLDRQAGVFAQKYGVRSKKLKRWHTVDDLKYMLGPNAAVVDDEILAMARYEAMTNAILAASPVVITDQMVADRISDIARLNQKAAATNELVFAKATNVWRQIVAKEMSFEAAATNYSEDAYLSEGCDWGCFTRDQLDNETALLELLPNLKPGDITPPIESDGGLAIIRKDEDDDARTYSFSRVFFKLPMFWEEENAAEARAALLDLKSRELINETMRALEGELKVAYPCGEDVVGKITHADLKK